LFGWQRFSGQQAVLDGDQRTFEEIARVGGFFWNAVHLACSFGGDYRVHPNCKLIPMGIHMGGGSAVKANSAARWWQMGADGGRC
jgi:hypothetical protein